MIEISFGKMIIPENERFIGFAGDNLHSSKTFLLKNVSETDCIYRLYLTFDDGNTNYFALDSKVENGSTYLQWTVSEDHIIKSGIVKAQIKAFYNDDRIYHTTHDYFIVAPSTECDSDFSEKENSEFLDYEKRLNDILTEITYLEKGFVPVEREIAGVNLAVDISCEELNKALNTYPIKKLSSDPTLSFSTKGEISQLGYLVSYDGKTYSVKMFICRAIQGEDYIWQEISGSNSSTDVDLNGYVKTSRTIAGVDLADDVIAEELCDALSVYPVLLGANRPQNGNTKGKVGQLYIALDDGSLHRCYSTAGGSYTYWQEIYANPKGKVAGFSLDTDVTVSQLQTALGIGDIESSLDSIISIQESIIGGATS